ncbi:efflux RND transporter permease subunit [Bradyrhizobium diazoefficiens]|uniref:efflux RND transporter permease subunit n=1 Tax=Bradyrhizobium diazoefficiens TaxID=1355477 RepID=UPI00190C8D34|nr:efflux RND transporter permease subunit [Bradyrhizobium diazoefficiens]QQO33725.1 efflux RND transporter permease subunit [Bradyrhizobium diazoefficiens]
MSAPFILRPIATTLMIVAVVLLGMLGYRELPIAPLPNVDFPTIQVVTRYPGASATVGTISGLTDMSSTSSYGYSQITLQFDLSRKIDAAAQDVQARINAAAGWIPVEQLPSPPTYRMVNPADTPVLILALTSRTMALHEANDHAATILVPKLSQIPGVGAVSIEGGQTRAVRLQMNPTRLAGLGMSLDDVRRGIAATTADNPKGSLDGPRQAFHVDTNDQLFTAEAYQDAVIAYRNGAPVLLRDVGTAIDGVEDAEQAAWFQGERAVLLDIQRQPGANTIEVVNAIKSILPKLQDSLPAALKISVVSDRTTTIRAAIHDVQFTLVLTVALVVLVIFIFLRKLWATVIPSVTLPVSLIATFGAMALCGFSLDNLSLMALTIASGFVVDDAIVMIENIARYVEDGEDPLQAALKGARQIGFTIVSLTVSLTVSLIAVFIPLLLMGGVVGRLFREFAITLSFAVVISGLVSLTLTPMMCAQLLQREDPDAQHGWLFRISERGFDASASFYLWGLDWVLKHRNLTLVFTVFTLVATGMLYVAIPKGFLPLQDTGLLIGTTDEAQDISFAAMAERQQQLAAVIARDGDVVTVGSFVGIGSVNTTLNSGRLYIDIGSPDARKSSAAAVMARLQHAAEGVHGITLHLQPAQDLQIESRVARTQYQYALQDLDEDELRLWSRRLVEALRKRPELADVADDRQDEGLQMSVTIDRQLAASYGVSLNTIDQTLYDAFGQRQIATVFGPLTQYHVILEVDPALRNDPDILGKIYLTAAAAQASTIDQQTSGFSGAFSKASTPVPLSAFARIERQHAPLLISHQGLFPATTISFNLADGVSLSQATDALRRTEREIGLPDAVTTKLIGTAAEFANSLSDEKWLLLAAIVTVYLILGMLYESYIHPITILSTLPSAGIGAWLALMLYRQDLNLISLIGIILLIGIVKKNAIMMVDFALAAEREDGASSFDAIRQACILRFRPIMMTTMAALFGALPLAIGSGTGSELRQPLGIAIVGGPIVSQVLTLYTTPVVYLAFASLRTRFGWQSGSADDPTALPQTERTAP